MVYVVPYKYIRDESFDPMYQTHTSHALIRAWAVPFCLIFLGLAVFVSQVILPFVFIKMNRTGETAVKESVLGLATGFSDFDFSELSKFGPVKDLPVNVSDTQNIPRYFYLTVPKLGITKALVETNAAHLNPDNALGHYLGSALPGHTGNTFIFGHSVLPVFYSPKNYKAIFSILDRLEAGDEILVDYNNNLYRYLVEGHRIQKPVEVDPLAEVKPRYLNESTITLMSCYPAGSKVARLLVWGVLVN